MDVTQQDQSQPLETQSSPNSPLDPLGWNMIKTFKGLRLLESDDNRAWAMPVVLVDPSSFGMIPQAVRGALASGNTPPYGMVTYSQQMLYNPSTSPASLEMQRTPTIFKVSGSQSGLTSTIWTPAAGKKVRLMGFSFILSKDAACASAENVKILDGATTIFDYDISGAALVAIGAPVVVTVNLPGNGYLSTAVNNVFYVNLNGVLTAGTLSTNMWGTEE